MKKNFMSIIGLALSLANLVCITMIVKRSWEKDEIIEKLKTENTLLKQRIDNTGKTAY